MPDPLTAPGNCPVCRHSQREAIDKALTLSPIPWRMASAAYLLHPSELRFHAESCMGFTTEKNNGTDRIESASIVPARAPVSPQSPQQEAMKALTGRLVARQGRLDELHRLYDACEQLRSERAAHPEYQKIPGWGTGFLCSKITQAGEQILFDEPLMGRMTKLLEHIAREVGELRAPQKDVMNHAEHVLVAHAPSKAIPAPPTEVIDAEFLDDRSR